MSIDAQVANRKCRKCGEAIPGINISGLCKNCCRFTVYRELYGKRKKNGLPIRDHNRKEKVKRKYGLTWNAYSLMIESQKGKCKICGKELISPRDINIDHCHETGKIRGILCGHCNKALGMIHDDVKVASSIIDYLTENKNEH